MNLFLLAAIALPVAALLDGISTVYALKRGNVETDPILVKLYGTDKPSAAQTLGAGMAIIAGEIGLGCLANHFGAGNIAGFFLLAQSAVHIYETVRNFKLE